MTSEAFHEIYFQMYDKFVRVIFSDGTECVGLFNDEFYEDYSILANCETIKIEKIAKMVLA